MKTKTEKAHGTFWPWVKKNIKYQTPLVLLFAALFVFLFSAEAQSDDIVINEVQISSGSGKTTHDYIEIYNKSEKAISIGGWQLKKRTTKTDKSGSTESSIREFPASAVIPGKGYYLWANKDTDLENILADQTSTATISSNNSIALFDEDKNIIDQVAWGTGHIDPFIETSAFSMPTGQPERIERKNFQDTDENSGDFQIAEQQTPTPSGCSDNTSSDRCTIKADSPPIQDPIKYPDKIIVNELYPYTNTGEEEFIELYNPTNEDIVLENWILHDASKTGKYIFPAGINIKNKSYRVVYKTEFKFALNNSGDESVTLFDPNNAKVSQVDYDGTKKGISYSFNGNNWHWTKFLTPGEKNKFEPAPAGTLDLDDNVYVKVYASFAVLGISKSAKVTWDFGDGHKSYLQKTRHKYEKTGKYEASVKFSEGSEDVVKTFTVEVKKVPHPDVDIVSIKANPKGSDAEGETITIKNRTGKEINFLGWSVATGSGKKLTNHPITEKFIIKKKQTRELTRKFSKFTLNNKQGKIELRYPDGKTAYKLKYEKKDGIKDDQAYEKVKGGWEWIGKITNDKLQITNNNESPIIKTPNTKILENTMPEIIDEDVGKQNKIEIGNVLLQKNDIANIGLSSSEPQVLGASTVREIEGRYLFTSASQAQEHYAIIFLRNIFLILNLKLNSLLNYFFA